MVLVPVKRHQGGAGTGRKLKYHQFPNLNRRRQTVMAIERERDAKAPRTCFAEKKAVFADWHLAMSQVKQ